MKLSRHLQLLSIAGLTLVTAAAQAAEDGMLLGNIQAPLEQTVGHGQTALWTLPDIATQYQPSQPTPAIQAALQAQREGRFIEALAVLEEAIKAGQTSSNAGVDEMNLLRSSFLLQGQQSRQAIEILAPLTGKPRHAADAWALTAMARLQQGQLREALEAAQRARDEDARNKGNSFLPPLSLSYALQGNGQLEEARAAVHEFNGRGSQQAVVLAREAELALTLGQVQTAESLVAQAQESWAANPYVVAVGGLADLIAGRAGEARAAFEAALRYDPKDTKSLLGLALAEIRLGHFDAGLQKLQAANEASPNNALILTYLGRAQQQAGDTGAAMASWRSARQADPKDPTPWLYQAQAELQANRPLEARENLREAQARADYRNVYRGENLLREDQQLLQANLAAIQQKLGLDNLALHTLTDSPGEKNAANLRNQADLLQGQRFGESARRSLLLQSLFDEHPGNLPAPLDIYGDGAGQTGAQAPQHGAVSMLGAQQASYNNYDELFARHTALEADVTGGSKNTGGEQVRLGVGSDTLGLSLAGLQYKTDGIGQPPNLLDNPSQLDNRIAQALVQWRPNPSTQAFVSYQTFRSLHGETTSPWDPINLGTYHLIEDNSSIVRLGLRHSLSDHSELRGLVSRQQTDQTDNNEYISYMPPYGYLGFGTLPFPQDTKYSSSNTRSVELQYRTGDVDAAMQFGAQRYRGPYVYGAVDFTSTVQQVYAARQQRLGPHWQLDAQLAWEKMDVADNTGAGNDIYLVRWLPRLGLIYAPDQATHVRLAAWRDLNGDTVGDATLAPATLAGIVTKLPNARNNLVQGAALGADRQFGDAWLLDGQAQRHLADQAGAHGDFSRKRIDQSRLAMHWQPGTLAASLAFERERVQAPPAIQCVAWDSVQEQRLRSQQLGLRWFASAQWTVNLDWSHNRVSAAMQSSDSGFNSILVPYDETFNQTDASAGWQFNRTGSANIGVRNAGDRQFQYTSLDPLNPRFSNGRLVYGKLKFVW